MNSNLSSKVILSLFAAVVVVAGVAGAVSVSEADVPREGQVGENIDATFTFETLYQDPSVEAWTLQGETELGDAAWTITLNDQAGNQVAQESYEGSEFAHPIDIESDAAVVEVRLGGSVPAIGNYSYDPEQQFLVAGFQQAQEGGVETEIDTFEAHHYTERSAQARQAIQDAEAAIEDVGGNDDAQRMLNNAISAYEAENFGNAIDLANQARNTAESAAESEERNQLLLMAGGGVVVLAIIVGAVYWYRKRQTTSKL